MAKKNGFSKSKKIVKYYPATKQSAYRVDSTFKKQKGSLTCIALDSCAFIDMAKLVLNHPISKKDQKYFAQLSMILQSNVLRPDMSRKKSGRFAIFMLPSVEEELSNKNGELYRDIEALCNATGIIRLKVANEFQSEFQNIRDYLVSQYAKKRLFLERDRLSSQKSQSSSKKHFADLDDLLPVERTDKKLYIPSHDSKIVAEATLFNLTLMSRDQHIVPRIEESYKTDILLSINKKYCRFDTSYYAQPRRVENIVDMVSKSATFPHMQNDYCLSKENKLTLYSSLGFKKTNMHHYK